MLTVDLRRFDAQVAAMLKEAEASIDEHFETLIGVTFKQLVDFSPKYTGLYASEHEIHVGDYGFLLSNGEDERERVGQFFGNIEENEREQLGNISGRPLPEVVTIGTAISYAPEIEKGIGIISGNPPPYLNAQLLGVMIFNSKVGKTRVV